MPKHIVRKIWIWVIGLSLLISIGLTANYYYQNLKDPCRSIEVNNISYNLFFNKAHAQDSDFVVNPAMTINGPCQDYGVPAMVDDFVMEFSLSLLVAIILGSLLNMVLEISYYLYNKIRKRQAQIGWSNLAISLLVIVWTILIFIFILFVLD